MDNPASEILIVALVEAGDAVGTHDDREFAEMLQHVTGGGGVDDRDEGQLVGELEVAPR